MHRLLGLKQINFDAAGEGAPGGAAGEGGSGEGEGGEGAAFDWGEVSEELQPFTEGKSPTEALTALLGERDAHKQGATRRREQIIEELEGDDDFSKGYAEKRGLMAVPKGEAELIEFAKSRFGVDTKYEHPEIEGADGELLDAFSAAARSNGVGPKQYKAMIGGAVEAMQEKAAAAAEAMDTTLREEWGDNFDENNVLIEDYLRAIGDEKAGDTMAVLARFPPAQQRKAADVMVALGKAIGSAERNGDGSGFGGGKGGSGDPEADWTAAKAAANEAGGYAKAPDDVKAEYNRAYEARKLAQEGK